MSDFFFRENTSDSLRNIWIQTHLFLLLAAPFLMQKNLCNKLPVIKSETQIYFRKLLFTAHVFTNVRVLKVCASIFLLNKNIGERVWANAGWVTSGGGRFFYSTNTPQAVMYTRHCARLRVLQRVPGPAGKRIHSYVKNETLSWAGSSVRASSPYAKVVGSIPSQDTFKTQPTNA